MMRLRAVLMPAVILSCLAMAALPAWSMGSGAALNTDGVSDPDYESGLQAIADKDWKTAVQSLSAFLENSPKNANAQNYLGYAHRKLGNLDLAFRHYQFALEIDPEHRGAHEYVGEAYLMADNLAKAEQHLKHLDRLCTFGCDEYDALKKAIAAFKSKKASG